MSNFIESGKYLDPNSISTSSFSNNFDEDNSLSISGSKKSKTKIEVIFERNKALSESKKDIRMYKETAIL